MRTSGTVLVWSTIAVLCLGSYGFGAGEFTHKAVAFVLVCGLLVLELPGQDLEACAPKDRRNL